MSKKLIDGMVDRFLSWKLPKDFGPDCYVSFDREKAEKNNGWPIGTNILTADQARQMIEHVLGDALKPLDDYTILCMHKSLPIADVNGVGDSRFTNIVRHAERAHGIDGLDTGLTIGDDDGC